MHITHSSYDNIALVRMARHPQDGDMKLFTSPLACSMASRIALEELGRPCEYVQIDHTTRLGPDGGAIHPLGMVPVLHVDDGRVLTENAAILQYVAADSPLVPTEPWRHAQLHQWLSFIGTELHKAVFIALLDRKANDGAKSYALANAPGRLAIANARLAGHDYLLDDYSIADIYLFTILNWAQATPVRLADYPALAAFYARIGARPTVARVLGAEVGAFFAERKGAPAAPLSTRAVLDRFNAVFQTHDPAGLDALIDEACVIDNTDGQRLTGKRECLAAWTRIATDPQLAFDLEDTQGADGRGTILWTLRRDGTPVARGVNVMDVRDGRIVHARGFTRPI